LARLLLAEPKLPGLYNNLVPIETQLQNFPFDQCPQYTALSYSWNSSSHHEDNKYPILVNGYAIDVTESLWCALHEFQTCRMENWFWIDAICTYSYRTAMKHLGNLRFMPQFSEGFHFVSERKNSCSVLLRCTLHIPCTCGSFMNHFRSGKGARLL